MYSSSTPSVYGSDCPNVWSSTLPPGDGALAGDRVRVDLLHVGQHRLGLDLDAPARVEQRLDDDRRRRGADLGEHLAVGARDLLPVVRVDEEHARPDDVGEAGAGLLERPADELEAEPHLLVRALRRVAVARDRRRAGDVDLVRPATTARE